MADETITVRVVGNVSRYTGALRKARTSTREFQRDVDNLTDRLRAKYSASLRHTSGETRDLSRLTEAAGGRIGELGSRVKALSAALGPMGLAVGVGTAAIALATAGAVSLTRSLGEIVDQADELEAAGVGLSDSHVRAVKAANDELDKLTATAQGALVAFAVDTGLAGGVESTTRALRGMTAAIRELGDNPLEQVANTTLKLVSRRRESLATTIENAAAEQDAAAETARFEQDMLQQRMWDAEVYRKFEEAVFEEELARWEKEQQAQAKRAEAAERSAERRRKAEHKAYLAQQALFDEADDAFFASQRKQEKTHAEFLQYQREQRKEAHEEELRRQEEQVAAHEAAQKAMARSTAHAAGIMGDIGVSFLEGAIEAQGDLEGATKQRVKRVFSMQKAADLLAASISGARAVTAALAFPPGPPATFPTAAATGAMVATQIGVIASKQPPSFHLGTRAGDLAPDETRATLTRRETVMTPQGIDALGVADANAGISPGSELHVTLQYGHDRVTTRWMTDHIQARQLRRITSGGSRVGRKRGRRGQ